MQHALQGDRGLVLKSKAKHAAISSRLTKPFHFLTKPLVVQYEVSRDGWGPAAVHFLTKPLVVQYEVSRHGWVLLRRLG